MAVNIVARAFRKWAGMASGPAVLDGFIPLSNFKTALHAGQICSTPPGSSSFLSYNMGQASATEE